MIDKTLLIIILIICCTICVSFLIENALESEKTTVLPPTNETIVYFFYSSECSHCHEVMPFINATMQKYGGIHFEILEVGHNITNQNIAITMNRHLNNTQYSVPEVIVGDTILIGSKDIPEKLESILNAEFS